MFQFRRGSMIFKESNLGPQNRGEAVANIAYAFTEQGVAMLSRVLRSKRAVQVNIEIMRAFVRLREMIATHKELARKLEALEKKIRCPV